MEDVGDDFESADAGASQTYPQQCSALRKNGFVMIKSRPCKIVEMSTSKTGKHGHAKVHMVGMDIFTNKKYEDICPSTHNMNVPNVTRKDFQLNNIDENYVTLMNDAGDTREDLQVPENDLGTEIKTRFENGESLILSVLKACGEEAIMAVKSDQGK